MSSTNQTQIDKEKIQEQIYTLLVAVDQISSHLDNLNDNDKKILSQFLDFTANYNVIIKSFSFPDNTLIIEFDNIVQFYLQFFNSSNSSTDKVYISLLIDDKTNKTKLMRFFIKSLDAIPMIYVFYEDYKPKKS